MSIHRIDTEEIFIEILHRHVSASAPIKSIEHLRGREEQSQAIKRALSSPGRSAFIYGDRGVGKTSLAQTSAYLFHNSTSEPILLSIDTNTTFYGFIKDLASDVYSQHPAVMSKKAKDAVKAGFKGLSAEYVSEITTGVIPTPASMNEAVGIIEFFFPEGEENKVAVVDEFERLRVPNERALFADFIKQIGDRSLPLKFIFCGVGMSLDNLLAEHHSCYRYLETIKLERLNWPARNEIVFSVAAAFDIEIDERLRWRICSISDGYPYYVHIVCEKLFWEIFDDPELVVECTEKHLKLAIDKAVKSVEPHLRTTYDAAVRKYNSDYEEVLWAAADHNNLERRSAEIFESYERLMCERPDDPVTRKKFNNRINSLKKESHAEILKGTRAGWYSFSENVIRGYVRLRAEQEGISLDVTPRTD